LIDGRIGQPQRIRVVQVAPGDVTAGQPFAMRFELLDANGALATNFNGQVKINAVDCLDKIEGPSDEGGKWRWVLESMVRWLYLDS
jgi:hypothetical protein